MSGPWIASFVTLAVLVLACAALVLGLLRRIVAVLEAMEAQSTTSPFVSGFGSLNAGDSVPPFTLIDGRGKSVPLADLITEPSVLLFLERDCEPCQLLVDELLRYELGTLHPRLFVILDESESALAAKLTGAANVLFQTDHQAARSLRSTARPQAFALDRDGIVISQTIPNTADHLRQFIDSLDEGGGNEEVGHDSTLRISHG